MNPASPPPTLALVVAVYNKPENLRLVFAAVARQEFRDFEVIIADDGSGPEIRALVESERRIAPYPIEHCWHEDQGWRKNRILNAAIRAARADWMVFIDGDCLPARKFLLDHAATRADRKVLLGRRVETSPRWTRGLTLSAVQDGSFERYGIAEWRDGLRGDAARVEDGVRIPSAVLRWLLRRGVRGMLGSNFSVARKELLAINGFDEAYDGPGCGEDSDIQFRLELNGVSGVSLRNLAIQYHLWHPRNPVSERSWRRFEEVRQRREARCALGLEHLPDPV